MQKSAFWCLPNIKKPSLRCNCTTPQDCANTASNILRVRQRERNSVKTPLDLPFSGHTTSTNQFYDLFSLLCVPLVSLSSLPFAVILLAHNASAACFLCLQLGSHDLASVHHQSHRTIPDPSTQFMSSRSCFQSRAEIHFFSRLNSKSWVMVSRL